ncbi:HupE/UreJ family protein [Microbacterium sp. cx-59]|uniref:HupE/UreJ family protein n=1 Tax=Microbacterium sp. cx-59 TaxID=2891207 RepID=UPI001E5489B2|nr:HupE/UreJ family protein [Microbacterium sp. cx-59]MCC4907256.1 HupE/UreJ family protein [Microbacterium sp. cx-59]
MLLTAIALVVAVAAPAAAHGFSSVVYADVTRTHDRVAVTLQLEYDLLVVSAADEASDDALFQEGTSAFDDGDADAQAAALERHRDSVSAYVSDRFTVAAGDAACAPVVGDSVEMTERDGVPYAAVIVDYDCPPGTAGDDAAYTVASDLFPDAEGFVTGTKTILTYEVGVHTGTAALDAEHPSFSTAQSIGERFGEFFLLGAEHLLSGIDHILFLLALIAGSRRLRELVFAATAFTVAHSVTFILAATGLLGVPATIIEPIIALSIAIVGAWHLWNLARRGRVATELTARSGYGGIDGPGWLRIGVVFLFGLVHGLGFASALGIDEPWSWTLLWSLLVFNVGIETVQLGIIVIVFPLLVLLRRRSPRIGTGATGLMAVTVTVFGLIWFVERLLGQ